MYHLRTVLAVVLLTLLLAACGGESDAPETTDPAPDTPATATGDDTAADTGRPFDSTDDAVIIAVEAALSGQNASAEWDGSELVVHLDGSTEQPTAWGYCTTLVTMTADHETARMVFDDGELHCDDRPGY